MTQRSLVLGLILAAGRSRPWPRSSLHWGRSRRWRTALPDPWPGRGDGRLPCGQRRRPRRHQARQQRSGHLDQVRTVTDKPVTMIINTHTHGDHTGSNLFFPATVEIVTHENTTANMEKMPVFQDPANKNGMPDQTYKDCLTLLGGNDAIDLYYFGPAHTNGDTFVVFRKRRVMHAGDVFPSPRSRSSTQQRRQRHRVRRHHRQGGGRHQERRHGDHRPHRR